MLVFLFTEIEGSSKLGTGLRIQQFRRRPEANRFMDWPSPVPGGGCHASSGIAVGLGVLERPQHASTAPGSGRGEPANRFVRTGGRRGAPRQASTRYFPPRCICHPVTGLVALPPGEWYNPLACPGPGLAGVTSTDRAPTRPK